MIDLTEVRSASETLGRAFEEYKHVNDQRLNEIERRGSGDVLLNEKLGRMDSSINKLQDDISSVKTALRRPGKNFEPQIKEDGNPEYKQAFLRYVSKGYDDGLGLMQGKQLEVIDNAEGGYMIPVELSNRIITRQYDTT